MHRLGLSQKATKTSNLRAKKSSVLVQLAMRACTCVRVRAHALRLRTQMRRPAVAAWRGSSRLRGGERVQPAAARAPRAGQRALGGRGELRLQRGAGARDCGASCCGASSCGAASGAVSGRRAGRAAGRRGRERAEAGRGGVGARGGGAELAHQVFDRMPTRTCLKCVWHRWAHRPTHSKKRTRTGGRATQTDKKRTKSMSVGPLELLLCQQQPGDVNGHGFVLVFIRLCPLGRRRSLALSGKP
jgi:hypothetical protein